MKKKYHISRAHVVYPFFLVFLLLIGVIITINQTQQIQNFGSYASTTNCTVSSSQLTVTQQEQQLLNDINTYRQQIFDDKLTISSTLQQSAAWQTNDMATHNTLSHTDSLGRTPDIRLTQCGYDISNSYGEAIAEGTTNPDTVFNGWKNDPAHNAILRNPVYTIAGISMQTNTSGVTYWTMDFGATGVSPTAFTNYPTPTLITTPPLTAYPTANLTVNPTTNVTMNPTNSVSTTPPEQSPSPGTSNTPSISDTPAPVASDMQISVSVKMYGIGQGGNMHPVHLTRKVTAYVYGTGTSPVTQGTGYLTYDGSNYFTGIIHLGQLSQGSYFIKLVSDNTLQVLAKPEFQTLLINRVNVVPSVTLYQGDMNGDNVLDINDYNLILPCFQDKQCVNMSADFNDDGTIDVTDYNLLLQAYEVLHGD